ncbi:Cthe_2314 family HEPN domain-containing protein [Flavobacterium pectinovorum]|uniref:Cthe-2314-like HEPN domain-containing protein n=1 Tax=Flavobacterium pectinovorum TaxID=29533 RepID=A0AB36P622_9FLAO|nr:Cthe_2314 family HEPN domain-containing protein [Flavobacterium pectinovorum]OXB07800.1 hypothetical protein B0A72_02735 [Flavobacterium pectinovorum]SHM80910.1 hypothetical protein SAMN05444387_3252 [Flavobacterium pectinovorum]
MNSLDKIYNHTFTLEIGDDLTPKDIDKENYTELEYYVNNTQFYFVHFLSLLSQLDNAVGLLSNFGYNQKNKISRGDHLTYNVENYMIRVISVTDRLLQLINMVYYLKVDESKVNYKRVIGHAQIKDSTLETLYTELRQILSQYHNDRNSVVHRHSFINKEVYRLQALYHPILTERFIARNPPEEVKKLKYVRSQALIKYTDKIKLQFRETNDACFEKILEMLDILYQEYNSNKGKL